MTADERVAFAHGEPLVVPVSTEIEAALNRFIVEHAAEVRALLAPFDMPMTDLLLPTWMRIVHPADVVDEPARTEEADAESDTLAPFKNAPSADSEAAGWRGRKGDLTCSHLHSSVEEAIACARRTLPESEESPS